jgi:hypothetical protein
LKKPNNVKLTSVPHWLHRPVRNSFPLSSFGYPGLPTGNPQLLVNLLLQLQHEFLLKRVHSV